MKIYDGGFFLYPILNVLARETLSEYMFTWTALRSYVHVHVYKNEHDCINMNNSPATQWSYCNWIAIEVFLLEHLCIVHPVLNVCTCM